MFENTKYLLSLAMVVVFLHWTSTPAACWQTPKTAEEYNNRGLDRQNSGDLDGAIADYTKALSLKAKPATLATIYNNRANAFMAKHDLAATIADYGSAIQLQPSELENYFNRGIALYNNRDFDAAVADYSKAIELEQSHALAYARRGVVKALLKKPDYAADFETAFRLDPSLRATYSQFYENRRKP